MRFNPRHAMNSRLLAALASAALFTPAAHGREHLTLDDVQRVLGQGIHYARKHSSHSVIAIVDREGFTLACWDVDGGNTPSPGVVAAAIGRAGAAAFLSSNQNAFSTRTAGWIIQQHFPPGVRNTPPGPLVGVGFSNLFFSDVNLIKKIPPGFDGAAFVSPTVSPGARAPGVLFTSLQDSPGGVPLYKDGELVGGVGVTGDHSPTDLAAAAAILVKDTQRLFSPGFTFGADTDEEVALAAQTGFRPSEDILASKVFVAGVRLAYVIPRPEDFPEVDSFEPVGNHGQAVPGYEPQAAPAFYPYESTSIGGVEGEIRFPLRGDPTPGKIGKASRLSVGEVRAVISAAAQRADKTRAGIRLPLGTSAKVFITVVGNPHHAGVPPPILGIFRTGEATMFSWDVSAQKARTALFFSNSQLAQSSRTVGFLAQRYFPPGLDGRPYGPYFGFQDSVSLRVNPTTGGFPGNPNLPNGATIFPGGFPLYRDGVLVGAVGISGDGVDQDDIIASSGAAVFPAPNAIRADRFTYRGARLPYAKFPRDPVK
jgi:uncharacterized protein GlcG (DUF336 family)